MNSINGNHAVKVLSSYRELFATNKNGSFKTKVSDTSGFIYADKAGNKTSVTGFRAASTSLKAGDAQANCEMRKELLQAFSASHASRAFLEVARQVLGLNKQGDVDSGNSAECSKPLSRRDVKNLLVSLSEEKSYARAAGDKKRFVFDSTTSLQVSNSDGWTNVSFEASAREKITSAYHQLPAPQKIFDCIRNGFSGGSLDRKDHIKEDRMTKLNAIFIKCVTGGVMSRQRMMELTLKTEGVEGNIPPDVSKSIEERKFALAKLLGQAEARCHERGGVLNLHVADLLVDERFQDMFNGKPDKLETLSRLLDKLTENCESLNAVSVKTLHLELRQRLGYDTGATEAKIPQDEYQAIDQMLDELQNRNRYEQVRAEGAFTSANLENTGNDVKLDKMLSTLSEDLLGGKNAESIPKTIGMFVKIALDPNLLKQATKKNAGNDLVSMLLKDIQSKCDQYAYESTPAEFAKIGREHHQLTLVRFALQTKIDCSDFHQIVEQYKFDNRMLANYEGDVANAYSITLALLDGIGDACYGDKWKFVSPNLGRK